MNGIHKRLFIVFLVAFVLNFIWENLHSALYLNYQGIEISQFILFRAALFDAIVILAVVVTFLYSNLDKRYYWTMILAWIAIAIVIEVYALKTGRWMYKENMPLIPWLKIGLTPTVQLAITGWLSYLTIKNAPAGI